MTSRSTKKSTENEASTEDTVHLYNVNDGVRGRDGGPYLDEVQARIAEDNRAYIEGREPNYDNLEPFVGVQLVTRDQLIQNYNNTLIASDEKTKWDGEVTAPVFAKVPAEAFEVPEEEKSDDLENLDLG